MEGPRSQAPSPYKPCMQQNGYSGYFIVKLLLNSLGDIIFKHLSFTVASQAHFVIGPILGRNEFITFPGCRVDHEQKAMNKKQLFLSILLALSIGLLGLGVIRDGQRMLRRVFTVAEKPTYTTMRQLAAGEPLANHHVRVTKIQLAEKWVPTSPRSSSQWSSVYVPIIASDATMPTQGKSIRLLASLSNISNAEALTAFRLRREITGCVWEDGTLPRGIRLDLLRHYPELDFGQCRVIVVGKPLPTVAEAKKYILLGCFLLLAAGAGTLVLLAHQTRPEWFSWPGITVPNASKTNGANNPQPSQETSIPSKWFAHCYYAFSYSLFALFPIALFGGVTFIFLGRADYLSNTTAMTCSGLCSLTWIVCIILFLILSQKKLAPYDHRPLAANFLPQRAKKFFDKHDQELTDQGFTLVGDFFLRVKLWHLSRQLLSQDRQVIALLEHSGLSTQVRFISVTQEGWYVVTTNEWHVEVPDQRGKKYTCVNDSPQPIQCLYQKGALCQILVKHQDFIRKLTEKSITMTRFSDHRQIPYALDYGNQLKSAAYNKLAEIPSMPAQILDTSANTEKAVQEQPTYSHV